MKVSEETKLNIQQSSAEPHLGFLVVLDSHVLMTLNTPGNIRAFSIETTKHCALLVTVGLIAISANKLKDFITTCM